MTTEKNKIGRPSLLTEELIQRAIFYLAEDGWMDAGDAVPSAAGLACYLGISRPALYDYKKQSEEFSYILEGVQVAQEKMLINGGLVGTFNSTITKLMMTKHGYSDKQDLNVQTNPLEQLMKEIAADAQEE